MSAGFDNWINCKTLQHLSTMSPKALLPSVVTNRKHMAGICLLRGLNGNRPNITAT